ncbi:hypothetical protein [Desulfurobacterium crinifex]
MRLDTVIKRVELTIFYIEEGEFVKAYRALRDLRKKLLEEREKKKEKELSREPEVRKLISWYENLWNGTPPEFYKYGEPRKVIGKHFKDLIKIYRNNNLDVEDLKMEYEAFKEANLKLIGWKKKLLGNRGIVQFRYVLPQWKGISDTEQKKWTTSENERGLDYYTGQVNDEELEF